MARARESEINRIIQQVIDIMISDDIGMGKSIVAFTVLLNRRSVGMKLYRRFFLARKKELKIFGKMLKFRRMLKRS